MSDELPLGAEIRDGVDVIPRHESWARIATHHSFVAFMIFVALIALCVVVVTLHISPSGLVLLGIFAAVFLCWLVWRSTPQRRRGFLGNAGLTFRIKADLMTELGANDVNVDSVKGVVTLRGTVPYADFREAAEHLARQQGAHQVINELTVSPSVPGQPESVLKGLPGVTTSEGALITAAQLPLDERVREALEDDPRVTPYALIVRVEDGIAYLTGRQETVQASDAATEVAAHVPGILAVSNDIEVMPSV